MVGRIDRPDRYNAFRARTVDELVHAFKTAWADDEVGVVALTGAGEKAFCTGGDQKQRMESGDYGPSETGLMARAIGEKRAREVWFLCRKYGPDQAEQWGLVNKVVPADQLTKEVRDWADEILKLSPTALKVLKQSFNAYTEHFSGIGQMAYSALKLFGESTEAQEGITAFNEKRAPDFSSYRTH